MRRNCVPFRGRGERVRASVSATMGNVVNPLRNLPSRRTLCRCPPPPLIVQRRRAHPPLRRPPCTEQKRCGPLPGYGTYTRNGSMRFPRKLRTTSNRPTGASQAICDFVFCVQTSEMFNSFLLWTHELIPRHRQGYVHTFNS